MLQTTAKRLHFSAKAEFERSCGKVAEIRLSKSYKRQQKGCLFQPKILEWKAKRRMSKVKNSDPETFPRLKFRKLREPEQMRIEIESLPLEELDYLTLVSIQKIVDGMITRELRRNYPEAEIVAQILKNPVVGDAGKAEVCEAVRERVRFNLHTRWVGR